MSNMLHKFCTWAVRTGMQCTFAIGGGRIEDTTGLLQRVLDLKNQGVCVVALGWMVGTGRSLLGMGGSVENWG
jgi:hypothetical protein